MAARKQILILKRIRDQVLVILASILFTIVILPVFLFLMVPCYIYRFIVAQLAKVLNPGLGKLLCTRSALCAVDDLYTYPKCTLLGVAIVGGEVDAEQMREAMVRKVIEAKGKHGNHIYPEFQQFFHQWMGFLFWKWEKDFRIEEHITYYEPSLNHQVNDKELVQLRHDLADLIPENDDGTGGPYPGPKSVVIVRLHHGMADGYSMLELFLNSIDNDNVKREDLAKPRFKKRTFLQSLMYWAAVWLSVPYYVTQELFTTYDNNALHPKGVKLTRQAYSAGDSVPVATIKKIRSKYNVTFSAVVMSALAGGIRKFMLVNDMKIPDKMHVVTPLPWPGHPSTLRNYWSFCIMKLPLEVADARERLKVLHKKREKIVHSAVAAMNFTLVPLVGALPHPVLNFFAQRNATTIMMSNFPGPPVTGTFFGHPILYGSFGGGLGRGNLGFGVAMLSYRGTLSFGIGIDQAILPNNEKADELLRFIKDEIHILEQDVLV
ncbi:hypothetical protein Ocin01_14035 [Orchesella cincta]|uniref:O-acyltransferase WSD1 C-terminal domain-containing protein n=1 Tax=Orchesella cincta TaxID=48709 RepID=A0A1D2MI45_ORCCI|nr:hypothetical protein Ocin01_14035 [Orchesella cincta]